MRYGNHLLWRKSSFTLLCGTLFFLINFLTRGQTREEAVQAARDGRVDEGVAMLQKLAEADPNDTATLYDLAVIFTWQGRSREATDVFEKVTQGETPEYVLAPLARAYRDQQRFTESERLVRQGLQRFPDNPTWTLLSALLLVDQGKAEDALELLRPWAEKYANDVEVWLAMGYAYQKLGDRFGLLRAYGQALRLRPDNAEAIQSLAGTLSQLGAPYAAGSLLGKKITPTVESQQAALMVRWGARVVPRDPRLRFEGTDAAIRRIDKLLSEVRGNRAVVIRLRKDRIIALRDREYWKETVVETERLRTEKIPIPSFVRQAEADALLALRRPHEAEIAYEEVLHQGKVDPEKERERPGSDAFSA
jgi:tetratricopeptide (TPR) repeat protein